MMSSTKSTQGSNKHKSIDEQTVTIEISNRKSKPKSPPLFSRELLEQSSSKSRSLRERFADDISVTHKYQLNNTICNGQQNNESETCTSPLFPRNANIYIKKEKPESEKNHNDKACPKKIKANHCQILPDDKSVTFKTSISERTYCSEQNNSDLDDKTYVLDKGSEFYNTIKDNLGLEKTSINDNTTQSNEKYYKTSFHQEATTADMEGNNIHPVSNSEINRIGNRGGKVWLRCKQPEVEGKHDCKQMSFNATQQQNLSTAERHKENGYNKADLKNTSLSKNFPKLKFTEEYDAVERRTKIMQPNTPMRQNVRNQNIKRETIGIDKPFEHRRPEKDIKLNFYREDGNNPLLNRDRDEYDLALKKSKMAMRFKLLESEMIQTKRSCQKPFTSHKSCGNTMHKSPILEKKLFKISFT